jgi:hypothetical protein
MALRRLHRQHYLFTLLGHLFTVILHLQIGERNLVAHGSLSERYSAPLLMSSRH